MDTAREELASFAVTTQHNKNQNIHILYQAAFMESCRLFNYFAMFEQIKGLIFTQRCSKELFALALGMSERHYHPSVALLAEIHRDPQVD